MIKTGTMFSFFDEITEIDDMKHIDLRTGYYSSVMYLFDEGYLYSSDRVTYQAHRLLGLYHD